MDIHYDEARGIFHLSFPEMSYAFGIAADSRLRHLYWGPALTRDDSLYPLAEKELLPSAPLKGVDDMGVGLAEVPSREPGDFSDPVMWIRRADGIAGLRLRYARHSVSPDHLTVTARDEICGVTVNIHYRGWGDLPLLSRWLEIRNDGENPVLLERMKSAAWHLPGGSAWRLTHFAGRWGCEYQKNRAFLTTARLTLQNTRLTCAAAQEVPFFALDEFGAATEEHGDVYFGALHWSGDFEISVEKPAAGPVTVTGGIGSFDTAWPLRPGESFTTPCFTGGLSRAGFGRMSEILYDWQLDHLLPRGRHTNKARAPRPVIYNSWYPFLFDVTEDKCLSLIPLCRDIGVELFVIDDGWMPGRVNDRSGLGDWRADPKRFPHGLGAVAKACHDSGMLFGLWVEPEMVNEDSDLYRAHPDWVIRDPARPMTVQRNQLILDLARDDVRDWAIKWLDDLIENTPLDYLKWDMNRYVTEAGWPGAPAEEQRTLSARYIQNLYSVWRHLNEKHPDVLFENCASGGGRADFGMMPFADRVNRSDNADPVDLMTIHEGFTTLFPPRTAGGAGNIAPRRHPIHGRETPLTFRILWGMTGSMSVGIDLTRANRMELERLKEGIADYKRLRADLQDAYVLRIASADDHPYALFQYLKRDRSAFTLFAFAHGIRYQDLPLPRFRMRGLVPGMVYRREDGLEMTGEALMTIGLDVDLKADCGARMEVWMIAEEQ